MFTSEYIVNLHLGGLELFLCSGIYMCYQFLCQEFHAVCPNLTKDQVCPNNVITKEELGEKTTHETSGQAE